MLRENTRSTPRTPGMPRKVRISELSWASVLTEVWKVLIAR